MVITRNIKYNCTGTVFGSNIYCSAPEQCQNTTIICAEYEDCFLSCSGRDSCRNATINCPLNGDCRIECKGSDACWSSIINATSSIGNFSLLCESAEETTHDDQCRAIKVYGSTLQPVQNQTNSNFEVVCGGDLRTCISASIQCPLSGSCSIECNGSSSCRWISISGPIHNELTVNCNQYRSCFAASIDGRLSSMMSINGCMEPESCFDISLYCPSRMDEGKRCFIQGLLDLFA